MLKKAILTVAAITVATFCVHAQNKSAGINLSLWKGISTQPCDSTQTTYLNIGVVTQMNRLNGIGLNILAGAVDRDVRGIQLSGLANVVGGSMRGIQASALANVSGNDMSGISISGIMNITGNRSTGVMASGLVNISGDQTAGVLASGLMNVSGEMTGVLLSGLSNIASDDMSGISAAGLLNVTGGTMKGMQVAGLANVSGEDTNGVQIAGLMNVAGERANGLQIAPFNFGYYVSGLQIGLVNYYRDKSNGFQLGLVNANPSTKIQIMAFGGNRTKINAGARFKNELFYTILGVGTHYLGLDEKFSGAVFYRAGLELPLYKRLFISGDLGYQHIETFGNKDDEDDIPGRLYALQGRINLEYRLTDKFGVFATGGYGGSRYYNKSKTYDKGVIFEAGVVIR